MKIEPSAIEKLGEFPKGALVELRAVVEGATVSFMLEADSLAHVLHTGQIQLIGKIVGADFDPGIDGMNTRQRTQIDRLLKHLGEHCPEFRTGQVCEFNGKVE